MKGLPNAINSCFTHTRPATSGQILNAPCFFKPFTPSLYWFYIRRVASITKSKFMLSINEQFRFVKPKHTLVFLLDRCYSRRKCCLRTKCTPESLLKEHSRHLLHKKNYYNWSIQWYKSCIITLNGYFAMIFYNKDKTLGLPSNPRFASW